MKKIVAGLVLSLIGTGAFAQHTSNSMIRGHGWHGPHHYHHHRHGHMNWIVPAIIGGAVVYAATRPDPVVVQPAPVIVQPDDVIYLNGIAYRKQLMLVNGQYQEVLVRM